MQGIVLFNAVINPILELLSVAIFNFIILFPMLALPNKISLHTNNTRQEKRKAITDKTEMFISPSVTIRTTNDEIKQII